METYQPNATQKNIAGGFKCKNNPSVEMPGHSAFMTGPVASGLIQAKKPDEDSAKNVLLSPGNAVPANGLFDAVSPFDHTVKVTEAVSPGDTVGTVSGSWEMSTAQTGFTVISESGGLAQVRPFSAGGTNVVTATADSVFGLPTYFDSPINVGQTLAEIPSKTNGVTVFTIPPGVGQNVNDLLLVEWSSSGPTEDPPELLEFKASLDLVGRFGIARSLQSALFSHYHQQDPNLDFADQQYIMIPVPTFTFAWNSNFFNEDILGINFHFQTFGNLSTQFFSIQYRPINMCFAYTDYLLNP